MDSPDGEILGTCRVPNTGGWQSWSTFTRRIKPRAGSNAVPGVSKLGLDALTPLWFAQVDATHDDLGAVPGRRSQRPAGRDQCAADGVLSGQTRAELHHRARLRDAARRHALGAADRRAGRPDRHALEQGLDHREQHRSAIRCARASRWASTATSGTTPRPTPPRATSRRSSARLRERLEQGEHRPPHRPQQHHLPLRAGGHRRQPGRDRSAPSPATRSTTSTSGRLFGGAEMAGIKFHAAIDARDPPQPHLPHMPRPLAGLDGAGHARHRQPVPRQRTPRTCSSRWTTGRSWWTTTCSSRRRPC